MQRSYWSFKVALFCAVAVGLDWIHYRDFHGRQLSDALMMTLPYVFALLIPKRWLGAAIAVPIGAGLVLSVPLLLSLIFVMSNKMDSGVNLRLHIILLCVVAVAVTAMIAGILNRNKIRGWTFTGVLVGSTAYYLVVLLYGQ